MRKEYYAFLEKTRIRDLLSLIDEIPYSKKLSIVQNLYEKYNVSIINQAFNDYQQNYLYRVDLRILENVLKGICNRYS